MFENSKKYIKDLLQIAFPIILGNVGFIMIGVGDVIIAGRHSTDTLAAISLSTAIINCITIIGIGILGSISPILSNYRGAGKEAEKYLSKFAQNEFMSFTSDSKTTGMLMLKNDPSLSKMIAEWVFEYLN